MQAEKSNDSDSLLKKAYLLAIVTIIYNIIEGTISIYFGLEDEALALFGFGADSFIETISASGILLMIYRMKKHGGCDKSRFETLALKITGVCFYVLAGFLSFEAFRSIMAERSPSTTWPGIIITLLSIVFMAIIIKAKISVGRKLNSKAIIADAKCGLVCIYMSVVVLISSALFEIFHIGWFDVLGTIGIIIFSIREGKEAFEKADGKDCDCD